MYNMRLLVVSILAIVTSLVQSAPTCNNVTIEVTTQPTTVRVPLTGLLGLLNPTTLLGAISGFADSILTDVIPSTTFSIVATYCEPEIKIAERKHTLQFLIHGATYTKNYWFGLYKGDQYSWVATASLNGYPTIAIDRLGNGQSEHPDPTLETQYPLQAQVVHQIIQKARAGTGPFPRQFEKIIMAGHSYGSIISNAVNFLYPTDVDATILTGFSAYLLTAVPAALLVGLPLPADVEDPRYSSLNPLYLEFSSKTGLEYLFYGPTGTFDQSVADLDYDTRGTLSTGEAATIAIYANTASGYTAPVYLMTAQDDAVFCNIAGLPLNTLTGLLGINLGGCTGSVIPYMSGSAALYPDTSSFDYYVVPDAGHCWQLHYSAQAAFNNAHQWMSDHGF